MAYRTHTCGELRTGHEGLQVTLAGWIRRVRDLGGLLFIDLYDRYGRTQVVVENTELQEFSRKLSQQYVIQVIGKVRKRPTEMVNPDIPTGEIEVVASKIKILNTSKIPPFPIENDIDAFEETRLKWRFLDLRRPEMQKNIILRHRIVHAAREFLHEQGFVEIETPYLTRSTPEGARDFLVPSRLHPGKFYALPQSPQIYKQILMIAGYDKYFQFARCFRDEDLRADRQPEHTQIDIEMSFVDVDDVLHLTEGLFKHIFKEVLDIDLSIPFPRITFEESIKRFGTDKPDLRNPLEIKDLSKIFADSGFRIFEDIIRQGGKTVALPYPADLSRTELNKLEKLAIENGAKGLLWLKLKGGTASGPVAKYLPSVSSFRDILEKSFQGTLLIVAGFGDTPYRVLDALRNALAENLNIPENECKFVWITDFPLFEWDTDTNRLQPAHHMFTMPYPDSLSQLENVKKFIDSRKKKLLEKDPTTLKEVSEFLLQIRGKQYDLVLNGVELCSGSIRIHKRDLQEKIMEIIGLSKEEREKRFGFLLEALEYGAPPHGGIAPGLDRIVMMMAGRNTIRDVIAFPKTTSAQALFEGAPSEVDESQLKELHIKPDL